MISKKLNPALDCMLYSDTTSVYLPAGNEWNGAGRTQQPKNGHDSKLNRGHQKRQVMQGLKSTLRPAAPGATDTHWRHVAFMREIGRYCSNVPPPGTAKRLH